MEPRVDGTRGRPPITTRRTNSNRRSCSTWNVSGVGHEDMCRCSGTGATNDSSQSATTHCCKRLDRTRRPSAPSADVPDRKSAQLENASADPGSGLERSAEMPNRDRMSSRHGCSCRKQEHIQNVTTDLCLETRSLRMWTTCDRLGKTMRPGHLTGHANQCCDHALRQRQNTFRCATPLGSCQCANLLAPPVVDEKDEDLIEDDFPDGPTNEEVLTTFFTNAEGTAKKDHIQTSNEPTHEDPGLAAGTQMLAQ